MVWRTSQSSNPTHKFISYKQERCVIYHREWKINLPLLIMSCVLLARVAWWYKQFSIQNSKAMKTSGKAANHLPGLPHFLLQPPIIYFDNVMIGFVIRA